MDNYKIKHPYLGKELQSGFIEVEIKSENLIYSEIGFEYIGVQCINQENHELIQKKCREVANLIREIDKLNKVIANN